LFGSDVVERTDREHFDYWCFLIGVNEPADREKLWKEHRDKIRSNPVVVDDPGEYE
jgi:hypothetical protein